MVEKQRTLQHAGRFDRKGCIKFFARSSLVGYKLCQSRVEFAWRCIVRSDIVRLYVAHVKASNSMGHFAGVDSQQRRWAAALASSIEKNLRIVTQMHGHLSLSHTTACT